jgi:predicted DNA-binding transcriptional regulator YafY
MVGHCRLRNSTRCFRVDRVTNVTVLEETFEHPEYVDAKQVLLDSLATTPAPFQVKVWSSLSIQALQRRIIPTHAKLTALKDGTLLTCGVEKLEWFAAILLSLGCEIKVYEPLELREAFKAIAEKAKNISKGL